MKWKAESVSRECCIVWILQTSETFITKCTVPAFNNFLVQIKVCIILTKTMSYSAVNKRATFQNKVLTEFLHIYYIFCPLCLFFSTGDINGKIWLSGQTQIQYSSYKIYRAKTSLLGWVEGFNPGSYWSELKLPNSFRNRIPRLLMGTPSLSKAKTQDLWNWSFTVYKRKKILVFSDSSDN